MVPNPFKPGIKEKIILQKNGQSLEIEVSGQELYIGEVEDLADAVLAGKPPRVSLQESWQNIHTIQALLESARTGLPVRLEAMPHGF
jgi:predicted dehydrogenase